MSLKGETSRLLIFGLMSFHCTDLIERCPSQIADGAIKQQFIITDFSTLKMHKWVGGGGIENM